MGKFTRIICVFLFFIAPLVVAEAPKSLIPVTRLPIIGGGDFLLQPSAIKKPTLLVFWASWCAPCLREISLLKKMIEHSKGEIDIIGVSVDSDVEKARKIIAQYALKYTNLIDKDGKVSELFGVKETPTLFLINSAGRIQERGTRIKSLVPQLLELLKKQTKVPSVVRDTVLMGTEISFAVLSLDKQKADSAIDDALQEIKRIEDLMTDWRDSDFTRLNAAAGKKPSKANAEIFFLIEEALKISALTKGAFDISYAGVGSLWDFSKKNNIPPDDNNIKKALSLVNYRNIELDNSKNTVFFKKEGMRIGLGGIAKGYAVDQCIKIFEKHGFKNFAIRAGGDLSVRGRNNGALWQVAIQSPREKDQNIALIPVANAAVATSGDSERFFMYKNKRYAHIIDPHTGYPADKCQNVTIIAKNGVLADALSTGVYVLGADKGMQLIEALPNVEGVIVDFTGKIYISSGLQNRA